MDSEKFERLYQSRSQYTIGSRQINSFDQNYIHDELLRQEGSNVSFLLVMSAQFDKPQTRTVREEILRDYNVLGIYDLGAIFAPATSLRFYMYALTKRKIHRIWFGELLGLKSPFERRFLGREMIGQLPEYGVLQPAFQQYLHSIEITLNEEKKSDYVSTHYRIFAAETASLDANRLSVDYYKPELVAAETKIAQEQTVKLEDIAEIILPRVKNLESNGFTIRLSDAEYPLRQDMLRQLRPNAPKVPVKVKDIITDKFLGKAYLNLTTRLDIYAANSQFIVRLRDDRVTHEYLTLYLSSDRMKAYFLRRRQGVAIAQLRMPDIREMPIVIPELATQQAANKLFEARRQKQSGKEQLTDIDSALFAAKPARNKPLQNEFLNEMATSLQLIKNQLVRTLLDNDLTEVELCYKGQAYKACLVLCGSILETLVLDWLSEIEDKDYFDPKLNTELKRLVTSLLSAGQLTAQEAQSAHNIRAYRNLIHPQRSLEKMPLTREECRLIMGQLRTLVNKRFESTLNSQRNAQ